MVPGAAGRGDEKINGGTRVNLTAACHPRADDRTPFGSVNANDWCGSILVHRSPVQRARPRQALSSCGFTAD